MSFFQWAEDSVKKMGWLDVKLTGLAGMFIGVILVKWIPSILNINIWWFIWATVICVARIYYILFFKK